MRTLGRIALILLITVASLLAAQRVWNSLQWNELAAVLSGRIKSALPSTSYLPVNDQWLEFTLSGLGTALRVRTNAVVDAHLHQPTDVEWWYAFEYQLLGAGGEVLRQGVYHHRTRLTRFRDLETGHQATRNFLLDPELDPTDGRSMVLYFGDEGLPTGVRIRPIEKDPELKSLLFRVYEKVPNPRHRFGYLWQRLGESKKVRLARGSVYGVDLLMEHEKQNLLRYEWKAVGPLGVEHEQYELTKLYIARELDGESMGESLIPQGLYCDATVRGMIPIPEGDWEITLNVEFLNEEDATGPDVRIHWYGRGINKRWQTQVPSSTGDQRLTQRFNGGQLEIVAPGPLVIRAWGRNGEESLELTPEPLRLRSYLVDASGSLSVDIDHVAAESTPFRLDIRSALEPGVNAVSRTLAYEYLDSEGRQIYSGQLPADLVLSNYDRFIAPEPGINLSEPVRYYFNLPPNIATARFSSDQELLLTPYTRPIAMLRKVRIPEVYQAVTDDQEKQPAWFLLRPAAAERLRREFRSMVLIIQHRPPETDPRLLTGDYDWQLYQPTGKWRARYLLVPKAGELPVRDRSLAAVYRELQVDQPVQVRFRSLPGRRDIKPSLLFLRDRATPLDIRVMLGTRMHSTTQIAGRQGELQLATVTPGLEQLTITSAEPVRWFINQAEAETPAYLRRLAMQVTDGGLEFEYLKESSEAEVLSGELYAPSGKRIKLRATIIGEAPQGPGPRREWTFLDRLFDISLENRERIPVLHSTMKPLTSRQRFFLPLGSDLPPGKYRISFTLEDEAEAYLTLYRLIAGQAEFRTFFREPVYVQQAEL